MKRINLPSLILCALTISFFVSFAKCNMTLAETYDFVKNYDFVSSDSERNIYETEIETEREETGEIVCETEYFCEENTAPEASFCKARYNPKSYFTKWEIETIATIKYMEAPSCMPIGEQRAWVWCFLNILDDTRTPNTVRDIVYNPVIYYGTVPDYPLTDENLSVVLDVITDYLMEKDGNDVIRELPKEYICYTGDLVSHNYYKTIPDNGLELTGGELYK